MVEPTSKAQPPEIAGDGECRTLCRLDVDDQSVEGVITGEGWQIAVGGASQDRDGLDATADESSRRMQVAQAGIEETPSARCIEGVLGDRRVILPAIESRPPMVARGCLGEARPAWK